MTTPVRVPARPAVCGLVFLAAVAACGDGGTAPRDDNRGRYEVVGGRLSLYGYGGPLEGGALGADPLVLEQPVRGQRWTYRRER